MPKYTTRWWIILLALWLWDLHPISAQINITCKYDHIPLSEVLKDLHQTYGLKFAYDEQLVKNKFVTITLNDIPLPQALDKILSQVELEAVNINQVWIVKKRKDTPIKPALKNIAVIHDRFSGETVPYARITVNNKPVKADVRGIFVLPPINNDTVEIRITSLGYQDAIMRIARTDPQNQNLVLELSPQNTRDTTIRAGTIFEVGERIGEIIVNARNVKWLPQINTNDALAPLSLIPGVDATFENIDKLLVRHQGSDKNLISFDGFNIYSTEHLFGAVSTFNINAIKDIRIRRGNFDISQGGRTSSSIEITGKTGNEKKFSASAGIDQLLGHLNIEGPLTNKFTYYIGLRHSLTGWYQSPLYFQLLKNILSEDISFRQKLTLFATDTAPSQLKFYDVNAKISFHPNAYELFSVSGFASNDQLRFSLQGNNRRIGENADWGNKGLGWQWSRQWNEMVSHRLHMGYSSYQLEYFHHDTTWRRRVLRQRDTILKNYDTDNSLKDFNLNLSTQIKASEHHMLEVGGSYNWVNIQANELYVQTSSQARIIDTSRSNHFNPVIRSGWIQYTLSYGIIKAISVGCRLERYNLTRNTYFSPRFEAYFAPVTPLTFKIAAGSYLQYVYKIIQVGSSYRNIWVAANNDNFPVNQSDKITAGLTWRPNPSFYVDVEAYSQRNTGLVYMQKTIRRTNNQLKVSYKTFKLSNHSAGIDCMVGKKWKSLESWVSYSFSRSLNQSDNFNNGLEYPALDDHLSEVKLGTVYWWRNWSLSATWIYGSPRPWDEIKFTPSLQIASDYEKNAVRLPAYHRLDASVSYSIKILQSQLDCGVKVFNLYNRNNTLARIFTLTDTPLIDYLQGNPFYTYQESAGMNFAFNFYLNWSF